MCGSFLVLADQELALLPLLDHLLLLLFLSPYSRPRIIVIVIGIEIPDAVKFVKVYDVVEIDQLDKKCK